MARASSERPSPGTVRRRVGSPTCCNVTARIEIAAPVMLNIVCFRWVDPLRDGAAQDAMNAEITVALQMSGTAVASTTRLNGRLCLRVCITNHRSRDADFDLFAEAVDELGARLEAAPS